LPESPKKGPKEFISPGDLGGKTLSLPSEKEAPGGKPPSVQHATGVWGAKLPKFSNNKGGPVSYKPWGDTPGESLFGGGFL